MASEQRRRSGTPPSVEDIAKLVFLDVQRDWFNDHEKAAKLQVNRRTLSRWRKRRDYRAASLAAEMAARDANPMGAVLHELDDAQFEALLDGRTAPGIPRALLDALGIPND